jgi:hypothetical protein
MVDRITRRSEQIAINRYPVAKYLNIRAMISVS